MILNLEMETLEDEDHSLSDEEEEEGAPFLTATPTRQRQARGGAGGPPPAFRLWKRASSSSRFPICTRSGWVSACLCFLVFGFFHMLPRENQDAHTVNGGQKNSPHPQQQQEDCCAAWSATSNWTAWKERQRDLPHEQLCSKPNCKCPNPAKPRSRQKGGEPGSWDRAFERNKNLAKQEVERVAKDPSKRPLDLVFFGDSITEHWLGTNMGVNSSRHAGNYEVYQQLFRHEEESLVYGLALGIGGDQTSHLLYRIENGELPPGLNPPLYWILIGTNNLVTPSCNIQAILGGIIQIVETLHALRPNGTVVVHSILPRGGLPLADPASPWKQLEVLNHNLACYVASTNSATSRVEFFNGTDYFLTDDKTRVSLTFGNLHPGKAESIPWGQGIVQKSLQLLGRNSTVS